MNDDDTTEKASQRAAERIWDGSCDAELMDRAAFVERASAIIQKEYAELLEETFSDGYGCGANNAAR